RLLCLAWSHIEILRRRRGRLSAVLFMIFGTVHWSILLTAYYIEYDAASPVEKSHKVNLKIDAVPVYVTREHGSAFTECLIRNEWRYEACDLKLDTVCELPFYANESYTRALCFECARRKHTVLHHGDHHDGSAANDCLWPKLPSQPCFYNPEVGGGVVDWLGPSAWLPGVRPGDEIFQQRILARYSGCHTLQRKPVQRLHSFSGLWLFDEWAAAKERSGEIERAASTEFGPKRYATLRYLTWLVAFLLVMFSQILYAAVAPYNGEQAGRDLPERVGSTRLFSFDSLAFLAASIGAFRRSSGFQRSWRVGRVKARGFVVTSGAIRKRYLFSGRRGVVAITGSSSDVPWTPLDTMILPS
ncbi:unnamed protein product, partial [Symbiodinium sp. CCMP2456]